MRVLSCIETLVVHVRCLKGLIAAAFDSSEPLLLLGLMGVSAPSLHIESTDSMIHFIYAVRHHAAIMAYVDLATLILAEFMAIIALLTIQRLCSIETFIPSDNH